ncbi:MAG: efflux RND transporter periplasmic adaptor subunit [Proteobacteria bacterium]|nr:efflux RND transporter periplasmic adaptor subunit [Pseudomonadota bacterium]
MKLPLLVGLAGLAIAFRAEALATLTVAATRQEDSYTATGVVEAVRQGTLGAQVSGRVLEVLVRSGDSVKAGQALIRIDADEAVQAAAAGAATASGAAARLVSVRADYERAQRLESQGYISVAALQRSEAALRSAEADARATGAAAAAARTRAAWGVVVAPYDGNVTDVQVAAGDLATTGRPLISLYHPGALRVVAQVPEAVARRLQTSKPVVVNSGESGAALQPVSNWAQVRAVDPATHSVEVRVELPGGAQLQPGQFARLQLPLKSEASELRIPDQAVLTRSEVTAVYVVDAGGAVHLRQVRLGPVVDGSVTVLSGLQSGEKIALDPVAAAGH